MFRQRILIFSCVLALGACHPLFGSLITYTHDRAGRLVGASYGTNKAITYSYTAAGDLIQRQFIGGASGDTDSDGMDDAWEVQYFGNLSRNGTGDFDGDGASDLSEFLAGTLPNEPASALIITRIMLTPGVSVLLEWTSVPGKVYRLQYKTTLTDPWTDLPGDVTATGSTASRQDDTLTGTTQRFYRLQVVP